MPPAIFCGRTARFVPDHVGNPEDRFSHNEALLTLSKNYTKCQSLASMKEKCASFSQQKYLEHLIACIVAHPSGALEGPNAFGLSVRPFVRHACCAYRNFWTVKARVLRFHIWIPREKIGDPYFSCRNYLPFWSYFPLKKSCKQDISEII